MFSNLRITNNVVYYDLNTHINIFEIFRLIEIDDFVLGMKIRNLKKGDIKGKSFKNALHILLSGGINCKFFSNGKIHIPGNTSHLKLKQNLEKLVEKLKKLENTTSIKCVFKDNFYYNDNSHDNKNSEFDFIIGKFNGILTNRIRIIDDTFILIPEEIKLIQDPRGFFYTDESIRKRGVYNNIGEYIGDSVLKMNNRKNLPKKDSYYVYQNKLYYRYNNVQFGEIIEPLKKIEKLEIDYLSTTIFYDEMNMNLDLYVSNTNGTFDLTQTLDKNKLSDLLKKRYTTIYNPNDYPAIKCIVYYSNISGQFSNIEYCSSSVIKIQIYSDRINLTGRTKDIVTHGYNFIKELLLELGPQNYVLSEHREKEIDESIQECTIQELYSMF